MLFSIEEIDQLNFFKDTAFALNSVYIAFKKFDFYFYPAGKADEKNEFSLDKCLNDLKHILLKLEDVLIDRINIKREMQNKISELNRHILDTFIHYGHGDEIYVTETLSGFLKFLLNIENLLVNEGGYNVVAYIPEMVDFNIGLDALNNGTMIPLVVNKEVDFKAIFDDLLLVKKEVFDLKAKYGEFLIDHKNATSIFIEDQREVYQGSMQNLISELNNYSREIKNKYDNEAKSEITELLKNIEKNKEEMKRLEWNIDSFQNIASTETQKEISKHYFNKAHSEKKTYWGATGVTIFLILLSLGMVGWALFDYYTNYISISNCVGSKDLNSCLANLHAVREATQSFGLTFFIMRFAFSLLLFLTVIYTSRIAIRAYNHWRHSENMHLKLASLNPFIGNLDKDKRDEIHIGLVPDYFGKDSGVIEIQKDGLKDIPTNIANVAIKALEQAGGTFGGKSNTEKNNKNSTNEPE